MDYSRPYGRNFSVCPIFAVAVVGRVSRLFRDHWFVAMAFPSILGFCASVDRKQKILFRAIQVSGVNTYGVFFLEILPGCLPDHAPQATKVWSLRRESLSRLLWWLRDRAAAAPRFCRARSVARRLLFGCGWCAAFRPRPRRRRGPGSKRGEECGFRWSPPALDGIVRFGGHIFCLVLASSVPSITGESEAAAPFVER